MSDQPLTDEALGLIEVEREAARVAREKAVFQKRRADAAERRLAELVCRHCLGSGWVAFGDGSSIPCPDGGCGLAVRRQAGSA